MFKKNRSRPPPPVNTSEHHNENNNVNKTSNGTAPASPVGKPVLKFHTQLAHGSPTAFVSGFSNVRELYQKIAECYDFPASEILFCTLNTYKPDMKKLLGGQIGLEDFIFAHRKGIVKEVELVKSQEALGLTITDNGAGYCFIKRIKEGSVIDGVKHIEVGDHVEKLDGENMVGKRHFQVAKYLKDIPVGTTFTIRLIEPMRSGFTNITSRGGGKAPVKKPGYGTGKETLRFKAGGKTAIEEQDDAMDAGIEKINGILESFMGINDSDLATQIWELSTGKSNSMVFAEAIDDSDLQEFGFTDDLIIEIWGAITDARKLMQQK